MNSCTLLQVLETRAAGMSITVFTNFIFSFLIGKWACGVVTFASRLSNVAMADRPWQCQHHIQEQPLLLCVPSCGFQGADAALYPKKGARTCRAGQHQFQCLSHVRTSAAAVSVSAGQCFLAMLCAMRWGVFVFFAAWVVIMTAFVYWLMPGTALPFG